MPATIQVEGTLHVRGNLKLKNSNNASEDGNANVQGSLKIAGTLEAAEDNSSGKDVYEHEPDLQGHQSRLRTLIPEVARRKAENSSSHEKEVSKRKPTLEEYQSRLQSLLTLVAQQSAAEDAQEAHVRQTNSDLNTLVFSRAGQDFEMEIEADSIRKEEVKQAKEMVELNAELAEEDAAERADAEVDDQDATTGVQDPAHESDDASR